MSSQILIFISELAIPFFCSVLSIYILPFAQDFITEKQLNIAVKVGVEAVEQYMSTSEGIEKKNAVRNYVLSKFNVSDIELNTLIEAYVYEMNQ